VLTDRAEVVIFDAPAMLPFTDTAILARMTSALILVSRVGATRADQIEAATQALGAVGEDALGVVLNQVRMGRVSRRSGSAPEFMPSPAEHSARSPTS
jgi:succinoglycan biosynthesis transport protein ExoP